MVLDEIEESNQITIKLGLSITSYIAKFATTMPYLSGYDSEIP